MVEFMCLFFPAFISIYVLDKIDKKMKLEDKIIRYFIYCILINLIVFTVVSTSNGFIIMYPDKYMFTLVFTIKYLFMSIILSYILPYAIKYIKDNFKIELNLKKHEKKIKKSN